MLGILESEAECYFGNCQVRVQYLVFGKLDELEGDVLLRALARLFFNQVPEIIGGEKNFIRKIFNRRIALGLGVSLPEIVVQEILELHQDILVRFAARMELSFVEAHTVIEQ